VQRLEGKCVILTGAAGGIGSLVSAQLRGRGAYVTGVDRVDCSACDETIIGDLASREGLNALADTLAARQVDILINSAGVQYFGPAERQSQDSLWMGYAVNLIAPVALTAAVLPQMKTRGSGQIVNIGSVLGSINYPYFAAYSSSKAGLEGYSEGLRRELHGLGIAVTHFCPRAVNTAFNNDAVNRFLSLAGMTADDPAFVADRIVTAIIARKAFASIGIKERIFAAINALMPGVIDAGLAGQTVKARQLFSS
jgi:short-subunit dehydrogenase